MTVRWIVLLFLLKIHLKAITSQHHHHHHYYEDPLQQYDDEEEPDETEETSSEILTRRRTRLRKESEECTCSCDICFVPEGPKACCVEFCHKFCPTDADPHSQNQYANQGQKVVFVPFPYPLIVPNNAQTDEAATEKQQSDTPPNIHTVRQPLRELVTEPVTQPQTQPVTLLPSTTENIPDTTTKKAIISEIENLDEPVNPNKTKLRSKSVEVGMLSRHRKMKQLNPAVKRSKPAWIPKYGIVPIPDHLAAKLMTQLTEVRALKAKRV